MRHYYNLKLICLTVAMAVGLVAQSKQAHADILTVAGGCFWCVEADFEKVKGVRSVVSGYMGDGSPVESVQIDFDPDVVSRAALLNLFFRSVDPTDAGGQFCDRGSKYTTAVFVADAAERALAESAKAQAQTDLGQPIVTPVRDATAFVPAKAYHQDFYKQTSVILTRFGPRTKATAYQLYRKSCGRDARVRELWGTAAPFAGG
jgi:peptide-methionine (S)-S-oxide reductase